MFCRQLATLLVACGILAAFVAAHRIDIPAGGKECFFEDLHTEDKVRAPSINNPKLDLMAGTTDDSDVSSRGRRTPRYRFLCTVTPYRLQPANTEQLTDPKGNVLSSQHKQPTGTFAFTAKDDGRFTYCFSNEMSSVSPKTLRSVLVSPLNDADDDPSFNVHGVLYIEDEGHIAPVEHEIRQLSAALEGVKDEQEYIVVRERVHRNSSFLASSPFAPLTLLPQLLNRP
jgi:hypothetical protein